MVYWRAYWRRLRLHVAYWVGVALLLLLGLAAGVVLSPGRDNTECAGRANVYYESCR